MQWTKFIWTGFSHVPMSFYLTPLNFLLSKFLQINVLYAALYQSPTRQDSNTKNDVVRTEVHKRKVKGKGELKSKTRTR